MPSLRIAHLSDMHLAGYEVGATFDEDADLRRELEDDLQRLVDEGGPIDLLVLGGDIAGRGRTGPTFPGRFILRCPRVAGDLVGKIRVASVVDPTGEKKMTRSRAA